MTLGHTIIYFIGSKNLSCIIEFYLVGSKNCHAIVSSTSKKRSHKHFFSSLFWMIGTTVYAYVFELDIFIFALQIFSLNIIEIMIYEWQSILCLCCYIVTRKKCLRSIKICLLVNPRWQEEDGNLEWWIAGGVYWYIYWSSWS